MRFYDVTKIVKANLAARIGPFGLVSLKYGLWFLGCGERWKQRITHRKWSIDTEKNWSLEINVIFFF